MRRIEFDPTLTTLPQFEAYISRLSETRLFQIASLVTPTVELRPYPGWYFGIAETEPQTKLTMLRLAIWRFCRQHQLQRPIIMSWYDDLRVHAYLGNDASRLLFIDGYYEPNEIFFLASVLKPGIVFLDIGANDGLFSLFASRYVGEDGCVFAFEPSEREFARLQANISLNNITNIRPYQLALYNTNGSKAFHVAGYEHEGQNTLGSFIYDGVSQDRVENVTLRRLDDVSIEHHLEHIDIIKMDVEGAEHAILEGALRILREQKPIILLELSDQALQQQGSSASDTLSFLRGLGYSVHSFNEMTGMLVKMSELEDANLSPNIVALPSTQV